MEINDISIKRSSVLIVDDNTNNIQAVGTILKRIDISLSIATSGAKALEAVKAKKPDLILLDIMMPEMDGYEVARILKSDTNTADIPIIFLTAKTAIDDVILGFEVGAVDYIAKPFNAAELTSRVNTHLSLKRYQDLMIEKNLQLKQLDQDKNEFLGLAAHDLKNPIYNISMLAKVIKEEDLTKEEIDEFATDILTTSERMLELIRNLLDINAIEQGKIKMNFEDIIISEIAKSCTDNYIDRAKAKSILLNYTAQSEMPKVSADGGFVLQILDNLISNAIKYSPFDKNIWVKSYFDSDKVYISIKDEGPGLSEADQSKLFGKFARLTPQPTGDEHSTGLGLSIAKKYAESMHGDIKLVSKLDEGCDFILELPIIKPE